MRFDHNGIKCSTGSGFPCLNVTREKIRHLARCSRLYDLEGQLPRKRVYRSRPWPRSRRPKKEVDHPLSVILLVPSLVRQLAHLLSQKNCLFSMEGRSLRTIMRLGTRLIIRVKRMKSRRKKEDNPKFIIFHLTQIEEAKNSTNNFYNFCRKQIRFILNFVPFPFDLPLNQAFSLFYAILFCFSKLIR